VEDSDKKIGKRAAQTDRGTRSAIKTTGKGVNLDKNIGQRKKETQLRELDT